MAFTFYKKAAFSSELLMPDIKMAICANLPGAISRLSEDLGFLMRVKMLSLCIILSDSLAVMSSPVY
jgi:hypothetical protein